MKNLKIEIKWGIIFATMTLVWMLLERLVGLHDQYIAQHAIYTNLYAIPAILIYVLALRDKRQNFYNGTMTYGQGFVSGLLVTVVVVILSPLTQYITSTFITPDYFTNVIAYAVGEGKMTQQAAEEYFNLQSYLIQSLMAAAIMGLITTAVVALFMKKK